jgi:hypothetical protein
MFRPVMAIYRLSFRTEDLHITMRLHVVWRSLHTGLISKKLKKSNKMTNTKSDRENEVTVWVCWAYTQFCCRAEDSSPYFCLILLRCGEFRVALGARFYCLCGQGRVYV